MAIRGCLDGLGTKMVAMMVLTALAAPAAATAGPGDFDRGFASEGTWQAIADPATPVEVTVDGAGRALMVRTVEDGGAVVVTRLDAAGVPDPGFGTAGHSRWAIPGPHTEAAAVVALADGRIAVAATMQPTGLARDGLVLVLGPGGERERAIVLDAGGEETANAAVALPDGKLLVAGSTSTGVAGDAVVWRVDPDTGRDPSFDVDGAARLDLGTQEVAGEVAVRPDGAIVVAGHRSSANAHDVVVWRLTANGGTTNVPNAALDHGFDDDGVWELHRGDSRVEALALLPDGRILIGGLTGSPSTSPPNGSTVTQWAVWRLQEGGALDPTFDQDGHMDYIGDGRVNALALQHDGAILAAGLLKREQGVVPAVLRLRPDRNPQNVPYGAVDRTFGSSTYVALPGELPDSLTVLADRRILASGNGPAGGFVSRLFGDPFTLTVTIARTGSADGALVSEPPGINCPPSCMVRLDAGTPVRLAAAPANGSVFAGWSGGECSGLGDCSLTLSGDRSVAAQFDPSAATPGGAAPTPTVTPQEFGSKTNVTLRIARKIKRGRVKVTVRNGNVFAVRGVLTAKRPRGVGRRSFASPAEGAVSVTLRIPRRTLRARVLRLALRASVMDPAGHRRTVTATRRIARARGVSR